MNEFHRSEDGRFLELFPTDLLVIVRVTLSHDILFDNTHTPTAAKNVEKFFRKKMMGLGITNCMYIG